MKEFIFMQTEFFLRILLAAFCGAAIGYERKSRGKGAGIRTHVIVALASALMMVVSKYGFFDLIRGGFGDVEVRLDPSRVASTIASGIGFLGAGLIFIHKNTVKGLTTAAGIWATAGVGMALGAGMYAIGIAAAVLIIVAQMLLHKDLKILQVHNEEQISVVIDSSEESLTFVRHMLAEYDIHIEELKFKRIDSSLIELNLDITVAPGFNPAEFLGLICRNEYIKSAKI